MSSQLCGEPIAGAEQLPPAQLDVLLLVDELADSAATADAHVRVRPSWVSRSRQRVDVGFGLVLEQRKRGGPVGRAQ